MTRAEPRPLAELADDTAGQLLTEWVILTATVVIPLGALAPAMIKVLVIYFNRIAGLVSIPFP